MANIQIMPQDMYGLGPLAPGLAALGQGIGERFSPNARDARSIMGDPYYGWDPNTGGYRQGTPWSVQQRYGEPTINPANANQYFFEGTQPPDWYSALIQQLYPQAFQSYPDMGNFQAGAGRTTKITKREQGGPVEGRLNPLLQGLLDMIGIERGQGEVPIRAHQGEYIMNQQATNMLGPENLQQLNQQAKRAVPTAQAGKYVWPEDEGEFMRMLSQAQAQGDTAMMQAGREEMQQRSTTGTVGTAQVPTTAQIVPPPTEGAARQAITGMGGQPDRVVNQAQVDQNMKDIGDRQFREGFLDNDFLINLGRQVVEGVKQYSQNAGQMPGGGFEQAGTFVAGTPPTPSGQLPDALAPSHTQGPQIQDQLVASHDVVPRDQLMPSHGQGLPAPSLPSEPLTDVTVAPAAGSTAGVGEVPPQAPGARDIGFRAYNQPMDIDWGAMQDMDPMQAMMMLQQYADTQGQQFQPRFGAGNVAQPAPTMPASQQLMAGLMNQYLGGVGGQGTKAATALTGAQAEAYPGGAEADKAYKEALTGKATARTTALESGQPTQTISFEGLNSLQQQQALTIAVDDAARASQLALDAAKAIGPRGPGAKDSTAAWRNYFEKATLHMFLMDPFSTATQPPGVRGEDDFKKTITPERFTELRAEALRRRFSVMGGGGGLDFSQAWSDLQQGGSNAGGGTP